MRRRRTGWKGPRGAHSDASQCVGEVDGRSRQGNPLFQLVDFIGFNAIPVAAGVAIFRYRLYEIDILISRTLVYGLLSATLALVYVVSVLFSQQLLRGFTAGSDIAVAGSTLLVVALFQPIRTRVQDIVNRRFYRARYNAARTIDAFSV